MLLTVCTGPFLHWHFVHLRTNDSNSNCDGMHMNPNANYNVFIKCYLTTAQRERRGDCTEEGEKREERQHMMLK